MNTTVTDVTITATGTPGDEQNKQTEADVKTWMERCEASREFDEEALKQYAKDRKYARGDSGFAIDDNLIGTYIDILEAFLYARDPDVSVVPAPTVEPPSTEAIRLAAQQDVGHDLDSQLAQQMAQRGVMADTGDPQKAAEAGQMAAQAVQQNRVEQRAKELRDFYNKQQELAKAFGETLEIVISRMWIDARLKSRGPRWVRSALTVGVGILKAFWMERTEPSPEALSAKNDLLSKIEEVRAMANDFASDEAIADRDAQIAEFHQRLKVIEEQAEEVVARGFVIDCVRPDDFEWTPGYPLGLHAEAPWNAQRIPMLLDDAVAEFKLTEDDKQQAKVYVAKKPTMRKDKSAIDIEHKEHAKDADAFTEASNGAGENTPKYVTVREIWDRSTGNVKTGIIGVKRWVKEPFTPMATTRFFPFFVFCLSEVDGERHPQSLVSRSRKIVDAYYRMASQEEEHRKRIKPKTVFNKKKLDPENAKSLAQGVTGEMVGLAPVDPNADIGTLLREIKYAALDPALYDDRRLINKLERMWGVQEALSGAVQTNKTATESEIQQAGFTTRTSARRDNMESVLDELALYTAEVALCHLEHEDVTEIAGPDALWPKYDGPDDLRKLVKVSIAAGSSGKPDTSAERQAWSAQLPLLQAGIEKIGALRNSDPGDIADCIEELMRITAQRSGDRRINIDDLIPRTGAAPLIPTAPSQPEPVTAPAAAPTPVPQEV